MIRITTATGMTSDGGEKREFVIRAPYRALDKVKAIPGRRWHASTKTWRAPATPHVAGEILAIFGDGGVQGDATFNALANVARKNKALQAVKGMDNLPQPQLRARDSWPHQLQAYHFAKGQPAAMLAMKMGRGKTKVAVDLIWNRDHRRTLIVCPNKVQSVWLEQVEQYAAANDYIMECAQKGTTAQRAQKIAQAILKAERLGRRAIIVVNYEAAWHEAMARVLLAADFDFVIADESHRIKAPQGRASQFLSKLGDRTPYRLCLTGTPMPHSPLDIFAQYRFLDKGIFGTSYALFRARYAIMGGYGGYEVKGYQRQDELRERFERIAFQCDADMGLQEPVHMVRHVELTPATMRAYTKMHTTFTVEVKAGTVTAANALSKLLRLQQITSGYLPVDDGERIEQIGTEKRDELADILEDLDMREPIVVFARFRHDLDQIKAAVEASGRTYAEVSGRANDLAIWQQGGADVIGVQIQAGGVGISLVRARYCIYYSLGYSLGDYEQSLARVHRPGQKEQVTYIHLIAKGTVDERVYSALRKRKEVIADILEMERGHDTGVNL